MTDVVGGLRSRYLHDSFTAAARAGLEALGWFDVGRSHQPLAFRHGAQQWDVPVDFNLLVVTTQSSDMDWIELGSSLSRDAVMITIDFYAQSDSLGLEVSNDLRDILRGRFPFGAPRGVFPILDFHLATPASIGLAVVDDVKVRRSISQVPEEWTRHVFSIETTVHDTYYGSGWTVSLVPAPSSAAPGPDLFPVDDLFPGQ